MATAAVSSASCNHLHNQSLPLIDIRLLSQSELLSLSLCSSCSSYSLQNDTDVSTPRIDRSVFNESAGSRKQTFSRLRLAPRATSSASSTRFPPTPFYQNPLPDEDNSQIISLLKSLFGSTSSTIPLEDNNTLVSVPIQYNSYAHLPSTSRSELLNLPISIVDQVNPLINSSLKKRKRGRPRKHENNYNTYYFNEVTECGPTEVAITESMENKEEGVLGSVEDPYGAELMMRTEGMRTEAELLGFLEGLDGEWMSKRKKKMIVDAGVLADVLPEGWKLMLAIKKRADHFWLTCRRYISPKGQQFMSYKEVSSYVLSFCGHQDTSQLNLCHIDGSNQLTDEKTPGNVLQAADLPLENGKCGDVMLHSALPTVSYSVEHERQATLLVVGSTGEVQTLRKYKCHKCTGSFDEQDDLLQHLLSAHHRAPKRLRCQTSMSEEMIIRNGKYECQFCQKLFEERHRFHGHLGMHIKDYFKRLEASGGVTTIQNRIDRDFFGVTSNTEITNEISSDISTFKLDANSSVETKSGKQDRLSSVSNFKVEGRNKISDVVCAEIIVCSGAESAMFDNQSVAFHRSLVENDSRKCTINGVNNTGESGNSFQNFLTLNGNDPACVFDTNMNQASTSLLEDHNQERGSETAIVASFANEKTSKEENVVDKYHSCTMRDMKVDGDLVGKDELVTGCVSNCTVQEDRKTDIVEQRNSEGYSVVSLGNGQRCGFLNNAMQLFTSIMMDSTHEKTLIENNLNVSKFIELGKSGNNELTVDSGSTSVGAVEDDVIDGKRIDHGRYSVITSTDEQICLVENNLSGTPKGCGLTLSGSEQSFGFINNLVKVSNGSEKVPQCNEVQCSKDSEFASEIGLVRGHITNMELEHNSNSFLAVPFAIKPTFTSKSDGIGNNVLEKHSQARNSYHRFFDVDTHDGGNNVNKVSFMTTEEHRCKDDKCSCSGKCHVAFGCDHTEQDAGAGRHTESYPSEGCFDLSENQETFANKENAIDLDSSTVDELKQKGGSVESLLCLSGGEQAQRADNNLHKGFTGTIQVEPRLGDMENPNKDDLVLGFSGNTQSNENTLSEFIWRTDEENDLLSGFGDTSSRLVQTSSYFPAYDLMSEKGGGEFFGEKFDGMPGFEGLKSGSMGNVEYNFLTSHVNSHSDESKVFSHDADMAQKFDSSAWLEKEALPLLPKIASRCHVPTMCVWCKNEFQHESVESEAEAGSVGFSCEACKAKFSGQFNLLHNVVHERFKLP